MMKLSHLESIDLIFTVKIPMILWSVKLLYHSQRSPLVLLCLSAPAGVSSSRSSSPELNTDDKRDE